jgi:hypothetical protein
MPAQIRRFYRNLALGYHQTLPPRSMDPEAGSPYIFRDALNLVERDGELQPRPAFIPPGPGLTPDYNFLPGTGDDSETPVQVIMVPFVTAAGASDICFIYVTNRNIWVRPGLSGAKFLATPIYTTGTITATNGSASISGAGGMLWQTHGITANALILISGTYYKIASITGETTATLSSNFTGTTGGGLAYKIVRVFPGGGAKGSPADVNNVFGVVATGPGNGTLYVAGSYCGTSSSAAAVPAVIKVENIFGGPGAGVYIFAKNLLAAGLDNASEFNRCCGLRVLQDGRVIVAGQQNLVFDSSHLNDAVWTVSPGGVSIINLSAPRINAMGSIGNTITLHDDNGVVLGYPTGLSDPPLRYQRSLASIGVRAPRTLREMDGAEYGMASTGSVIQFDLNRSVVISDPIKPSLEAVSAPDFDTWHASVDVAWKWYALYAPSTATTLGWLYQTESGRWWPQGYAVPIGAVSDHSYALAISANVLRGLAGLWNLDASVEQTDAFRVFEFDAAPDSGRYAGVTTTTYRFTTEDLDFGAPEVFKCAHRLVLWGYRATTSFGGTGTIAITVSVSRDGGKNWTALPAQNWPTTTDAEDVLQFSFDELAPGAGTALRFRVEVTDARLLRFRRMLIVALESGPEEQVSL